MDSATSMSALDPQTITRLLNDVRAGDQSAAESLLPLIYDDLKSMASSLFSGEKPGHPLQPTALIHEAWLKVAGSLDRMQDRQHFFAIASRAMRQVLTDHARSNLRQKRGEGRKQVTLDDAIGVEASAGVDLVDLNDSLERLSELNARHAQVVEFRLLGGMTIAEAADALGVSHSTIENDWFTAKAWLRKDLSKDR